MVYDSLIDCKTDGKVVPSNNIQDNDLVISEMCLALM